MRLHIWGWFVVFILAVLILLWFFQILFLQNFYNRMKTADIMKIADTMKKDYLSGDYAESFYRFASDNQMCIEVRDQYERSVFSVDALGSGSNGNCFIHGPNNHAREIIRLLKRQNNRVLIGKENNPATQVDILIYASVIGPEDQPQGYLLLNTPLVPVSATVNILKKQLLMISVMLILIAFVISVVVSHRLAKPIVQVTKEAEQLAHGRYDIQFTGGGYYEADRLADTLTYASYEINRVDTMQRDLIANASHDLRTPLTMLKGYAELIRDVSGDNPVKREQHLQVIIEETDRLTALVNDILDLSKYENGKMTLERSEFDMEERLREIAERYRGLSEVSGYHFSLETDGPAPVCCDAGKIEQVICNLINNAVNYTGDSKQIFLKQEHVPEGIRISVRDTGKGMDQETLSRIFDKYYRSSNYKREVRGTGLGLSIVKAILRLHDYAFGVDSTVGVGSTFWFVIHPDQKSAEQKQKRA
ncbi:MAG: sensor histidine kinase [Oscillospiraceae bacterium]|nr:sensor histidine kinase [Oscillospiraceae bacterium]